MAEKGLSDGMGGRMGCAAVRACAHAVTWVDTEGRMGSACSACGSSRNDVMLLNDPTQTHSMYKLLRVDV